MFHSSLYPSSSGESMLPAWSQAQELAALVFHKSAKLYCLVSSTAFLHLLTQPSPIANAPLQRAGGACRRPPLRSTHSLQVRLTSNILPIPPCLAACRIGFSLYCYRTSTHSWKVKRGRLHLDTQACACTQFKATSILVSWTVPRTLVEVPQFQPVC